MEIQPGIDIRLGDCLDQIICGDNVAVLKTFADACIDLTVTSPPYDSLRTYKGFTWDFEGVAQELYRVTKPGGIVVWVVNDETEDFCESLTSFDQAIFFVRQCGFRLHDTMIYNKIMVPPAYPSLCRYAGAFEYMFVLSKDKPGTFDPLQEPKIGTSDGIKSYRQADGTLFRKIVKDNGKATKARTNVWTYAVGYGHSASEKDAHEHPAIFPEQLAEDHVLSWSNPGEVVLDPFSGSGTTAKMALLNGRRFIGIDISQDYCDIARRRLAEAYVALGNIDAAQAVRPVPNPLAAGAEQMRLF